MHDPLTEGYWPTPAGTAAPALTSTNGAGLPPRRTVSEGRFPQLHNKHLRQETACQAWRRGSPSGSVSTALPRALAASRRSGLRPSPGGVPPPAPGGSRCRHPRARGATTSRSSSSTSRRRGARRDPTRVPARRRQIEEAARHGGVGADGERAAHGVAGVIDDASVPTSNLVPETRKRPADRVPTGPSVTTPRRSPCASAMGPISMTKRPSATVTLLWSGTGPAAGGAWSRAQGMPSKSLPAAAHDGGAGAERDPVQDDGPGVRRPVGGVGQTPTSSLLLWPMACAAAEGLVLGGTEGVDEPGEGQQRQERGRAVGNEGDLLALVTQDAEPKEVSSSPRSVSPLNSVSR